MEKRDSQSELEVGTQKRYSDQFSGDGWMLRGYIPSENSAERLSNLALDLASGKYVDIRFVPSEIWGAEHNFPFEKPGNVVYVLPSPEHAADMKERKSFYFPTARMNRPGTGSGVPLNTARWRKG